MTLDFVDIDHIVLRVRSLEEGGEHYRRLGFTLTPNRAQVPQDSWVSATESGRETKGQATINQRQVLFRPHPGRDDVANFIAMIAVEDQLNTPPEVTQMMSYLGDSLGPRAIVLMTKDVQEARRNLEADGFTTFKPVRFDTGWQDDERDHFVPVSSSACLPVHGQVPFMFDPFQTWNLDSYTYAPWVEHPNGARRIVAVNGITDDVKRDAEIMASRVWNREIEWQSPEMAVIRRRDVMLRIVSPAGFDELFPEHSYSIERVSPHIFGLSFAIESKDKLTGLLDRNGVSYGEGRDGVVVDRADAQNTLLEFVETPS